MIDGASRELRMILLRALPTVCPNPLSKGSAIKRAKVPDLLASSTLILVGNSNLPYFTAMNDLLQNLLVPKLFNAFRVHYCTLRSSTKTLAQCFLRLFFLVLIYFLVLVNPLFLRNWIKTKKKFIKNQS